MSISITGTYQNGQVKLDTIPEGIERARVTVEFVEQLAPLKAERQRGIVHFGMFAPPDGHFTSDEELERIKKSWNAKMDDDNS